jgi:hypothetical protein
MNFLKFDLGQQNAGAMAIATLSGVESDVFIVDSLNLTNFEQGRSYNYHGGHYNQSPIRLQVPSSGHWYLVVVPIGGSVRAEVEVLGP